MRPFVKIVSVLLMASGALAYAAIPARGNSGYLRFEEEKHLRRQSLDKSPSPAAMAEPGRVDLKPSEGYYLYSVNRPSRIQFAESKTAASAGSWIEATIERLRSDGSSYSRCSFPLQSERLGTYYMKLQSFANWMEIFQVFKSYADPKMNMLEIYAVNMTDCSSSRIEAFKGYDFPNKPIYFVPRDFDILEMFSYDGQSDCGSYMCRRNYYLTNQTISGPYKFTMLDDKLDWTIEILSAYPDGYYAIIRKGDLFQALNAKYSGELVSTPEEKIEGKLYKLRYSNSYGYFGLCYSMESSKQSLRCLQWDPTMKKLLDQSFDLGYESNQLAVRNRAQGGLYLLGGKCLAKDASSSAEYKRCKEAEYKLETIGFGGLRELYASYKEDSCVLGKSQPFDFYDELYSQNCIYYECESLKSADNENYIRTRCF